MGVREGSKNNNKKRSICLIKDRKKKKRVRKRKNKRSFIFSANASLSFVSIFLFCHTAHTKNIVIQQGTVLRNQNKKIGEGKEGKPATTFHFPSRGVNSTPTKTKNHI